ncbi:transposase (plasmid) [Cupriavidus sp. KK10]|uniref:transposase n=1 Tax=Cupriavidus sp. KK10 TaxID=1478019 RepID=UPI001BA8835C|nr:transposase [Cupriavidus sp. KK10]QUN32474.1 transposase [Cupriavidus sp. KK10]
MPAHTEYSVLQLICEVGTDLTRWPTEKHFTAWMGLAPGSHQSGKRRGSVKRHRNRAGRLFCLMARSAQQGHRLGWLLPTHSSTTRRTDCQIALARKLAILFWRVMVKGMQYVESGLAHYEARVLETKRRALRRLAKQLGQELVSLPTAA